MSEQTIKRIAIVDLEATGAYFDKDDEMIQIAAVIFEAGEVVAEHSMLLNPEREIPDTITQLTGITQERVATAPKFAQVASLWYERLKDCIFVAHNLAFDLSFLTYKFAQHGYPDFNPPALDTVPLCKMLLPTATGFNLSDLGTYLNVEFKNAHDALADAQMTAYVVNEMAQRLQQLAPNVRASLRTYVESLSHDALLLFDYPELFRCTLDSLTSLASRVDLTLEVEPQVQQKSAYILEQLNQQQRIVVEDQQAAVSLAQRRHTVALCAQQSPCLLLVANEWRMQQWQTSLEHAGISATYYRTMQDVMNQQQFDHVIAQIAQGDQTQQLIVLGGALHYWFATTNTYYVDELNAEFMIRDWLSPVIEIYYDNDNDQYYQALDQQMTYQVLLMTYQEAMRLARKSPAQFAQLMTRVLCVEEYAGLYQALVQRQFAKLNLSQLFVDLRQMELQVEVVSYQNLFQQTISLIHALMSTAETYLVQANSKQSEEWVERLMLADDTGVSSFRAQLLLLQTQLAKLAKLTALSTQSVAMLQQVIRHITRMMELMDSEIFAQGNAYVCMQGRYVSNAYYQVSVKGQAFIQDLTASLPALQACQQWLCFSDGNYHEPLGMGMQTRLNEPTLKYVNLPQLYAGKSVTTVHVPVDYQANRKQQSTHMIEQFIMTALSVEKYSHIMIVMHNRKAVEALYQYFKQSQRLVSDYLIMAYGVTGSVKRIKRRIENAKQGIVIVTRTCVLSEEFEINVPRLTVVIESLPFMSINQGEILAMAQHLKVAPANVFDRLVLPQMCYDFKKMVRLTEESSDAVSYFLLDERVFSKYYAADLNQMIASTIHFELYMD